MNLVRRLATNHALRDWSCALVIVIIGLGDLSANAHSENFPGASWRHAVFLVLSALPLAFRRLAPATVAVASMTAVTLWDVLLYPPKNQASFEAFLVMLALSYVLGADLRGSRQRWVTTLVGLVIFPGWLFSLGVGQSPGDVIPSLIFTVLAWVVGYTLRRRKEQAALERARADGLAFERGRVAAEAAIDERSRIARELHDVVAHSLSVMVVQAAAERRALAVGNSDSATTSVVLESVETAGREALVELRRLLGLIRRTDDAPSRAPQPSLRHLEALVEQVTASGVRVEVTCDGDLEHLAPGIDLAAYRVVQESLTNIVKHACASTAQVRIRRFAGVMEIEITDDGTAAGESLPAGGHGLIGMRERVAMYDGTLETGPRESLSGFRVHARLPVNPAALAAER